MNERTGEQPPSWHEDSQRSYQRVWACYIFLASNRRDNEVSIEQHKWVPHEA